MRAMAKKNPFKEALIFTVVALALTLTYTLLLKPKIEKEEKLKADATLLFNLERSKVFDIEILKEPDSKLRLKKSAENAKEWILEERGRFFSTDSNTVEGLLSSILAARKESTLSNPGEPSSLGLEPPKITVKIHAEGLENPKELHLGLDTPVEYQVYARWPLSQEIFTTSRSLRFALDKSSSDFRDRKVLQDFQFQNLKSLDIQIFSSQDNLKPGLFRFLKLEDSWNLTHAGKTVKIESELLENFIKKIQESSVIAFVSDESSEKNKWGLASPLVRWTAEWTSGDASSAGNQSAKKQEWSLARQRSADQSGAAIRFYLSEKNLASTFEMNSSFLENFQLSPNQFRKSEIENFQVNEIQSFSVTDTEKTLEFKKTSEGEWSLKVVLEGEENWLPVKNEDITSLLSSLSLLKIEEYLDGQTPFQTGLQKPLRVLEFRKAAGDQVVNLYFGRKLKGKSYAFRSEKLMTTAQVHFDVESLLPMDAKSYLKNPQSIEDLKNQKKSAPTSGEPQNAFSPTPTPPQNKKGKPMKLEPTVSNKKDLKKLPAPIVKEGHRYTAVFTLENNKKIVVEFASKKAPYTVSNFLHLARNGFYNGLKFHRVIADFVAQGGDPEGRGTGGPGWSFDDEKNDLTHVPGAISMANAGPNTNGSQFFFLFTAQPHLNGRHTVFGKVVEGLENMMAIKQGDIMKTVEVFEEAL